jgi:hypothetical protein
MVFRYQLVAYYLNAFEQQRKAMSGLAGCASSPFTTTLCQAKSSLQFQAELKVFFFPTAATSSTPTGLVGILLASGGNFLLPIILSVTQLAVSRYWPDSDIPQNLEQVKVIVNVVGVSATSLVIALKRWRLSRITGMLAAPEVEVEAAAIARQVTVDVTETTPLLGSQSGAHLKGKTSKERQVEVKYNAALIDIGSREDLPLLVTYPSGFFPDSDIYFSCVSAHDRLV